MKQSSTRLSLTSLDDRIVPSTSISDPNQSGVVNAIYIEGTGVGGIDASNPSLDDSGSVSVLDFSTNESNSKLIALTLATPGDSTTKYEGISPELMNQLFNELQGPYGRVNPDRTKLAPVLPTPTLPNVDANGVEVGPRTTSKDEKKQINDLMALITKNIDAIKLLDEKLLQAELRRIALLRDPVTNAVELKKNAREINALKDGIYKLQRKNQEMMHAIKSINQNAKNGYPEDSIVAPKEVFDQTKIGTSTGTFVGIDAVLLEK